MAKKKQTQYAKTKEHARDRIRLMVLYLETKDVDQAERDEMELEIRRLAEKYGLQKLLRSHQII